MPQKMSKEARELVIARIQEEGFASTDEIVEFIDPFYDFDPRAARKREVRRYVAQLVRSQRDAHGVRVMFLEKSKAEIVDIDVCKDVAKIVLVRDQLKRQNQGVFRSYKKAAKRRYELDGQLSLFNETALLLALNGTG